MTDEQYEAFIDRQKRILERDLALPSMVLNASSCQICDSSATLYRGNRFQCTNNENHVADTVVGIWSDLTCTGDKK